jgi:hypothetical protein
MPFNDNERQLIKKIVGGYCEQIVPAHLKNQVRVFYNIKGYSVTIFQSEPSFPGSHLWPDDPIAKLKYDPRTSEWQLFKRNLSGEWQRYPEFKSTKHLQSVIDEIANDSYHVLWGGSNRDGRRIQENIP